MVVRSKASEMIRIPQFHSLKVSGILTLNLVMLVTINGFSAENASFSFFNLPFFLAFFMPTEPKTTPHKKQVLFGLIFSAIMFALLLAGIR